MSSTYHLRQTVTADPPTKQQRTKIDRYIQALPTVQPRPDGAFAIARALLTWLPDGLAVQVDEDEAAALTDLTHLIWFALEKGMGLFVGAPEDPDEWETDAIAAVFGFRPARGMGAGPEPEPEPIPWPPEGDEGWLVPFVPPASLPWTFMGPNWEEMLVRACALGLNDAGRPPFTTLWIGCNPPALFVTGATPADAPRTAAAVEQIFDPLVALPPLQALPADAHPVLTIRADGTFVRLWQTVPRGRRPKETVRMDWGRWQWENRPFRLTDRG